MKKYISIIAVAAMLLSGCATPYQSTGYTGGHTYERFEEDLFAVSFGGNGFTSMKRTRDFCLLRCAEVTLEYQFKFFSIERVIDKSGVDRVDLGTTSNTTGSVNVSGNYGYYNGMTTTTTNTVSVYKPGITYVIRCYDEPPTSGHHSQIYNAQSIETEIRNQYKLE